MCVITKRNLSGYIPRRRIWMQPTRRQNRIHIWPSWKNLDPDPNLHKQYRSVREKNNPDPDLTLKKQTDKDPSNFDLI